MTTAFPGAIDNFVNPSPGTVPLATTFGGRTHSQEHGDVNDAVEAIEGEVGVTGSAVTTSLRNQVTRALAQPNGATAIPQVFTANGNLTLASLQTTLNGVVQTAYAVRVRMVGGGGGGGGVAVSSAGNASIAGGGQSGAYTEFTVLTSALTFPVAIVIGSAGAANSGAAGGNGGNTTFAATVATAPGGVGGTTVANGATGGSIAGGFGTTIGTITAPLSAATTVLLAGNEGGPGARGVAGVTASGGYGAGSLLGAGIQATAAVGASGGAVGRAAPNYGSGGSGAYAFNAANGPFAGGAGTAGVVIVEPIFK